MGRGRLTPVRRSIHYSNELRWLYTQCIGSTYYVQTDAGKETLMKFLVVQSTKSHGLLGRNVIDSNDTKLSVLSVNREHENLPAIKNFKASISLINPDEKLKFCRARQVPIHLKEKIKAELKQLENQGIITPVDHASNASPVVWVKKANGKFRMCVDFKATLNKNIQSDVFPLPTTEEIFANIGNSTRFAKLDLKSAYHQIELDDDAKSLSCINTSSGLFRLNRLQMGMKNASAIFQRCMEHILKNIPGVVIYQDDIMIHAVSDSQLHKRYNQVLKRLEENNVTVNCDKCKPHCDSLTFLGYNFSARGIKPDSSLLSQIEAIPIPQSALELKSFLGLINYYGMIYS